MYFKIKQTRFGFTLIEMIVVIIILSVLAALALPMLFSTVEYSRSSEALSSIRVVRKGIEFCHITVNDYTQCDEFADLNVGNPEDEVGNHFTYVISSTSSIFTITATRNTLNGGDGTSWIWLTQDDYSETITKGGSGVFAGIK